MRPGITLMEVLISIGVLSIGLLGVAALMPLAMYKAQQGSSNDRKSLVGRRAFREFRIREMHNPGTPANPRWVDPSGNNLDWVFDPAFQYRFSHGAYCIDPYYLATGNPFVEFPPNNKGAYCRIVRLTEQGVPMDNREAAAVFVSEDDLEVEIPTTVDQLVVSSDLKNSEGTLAKRYANGRFSWMATLVPQHNMIPFPYGRPPNDQYFVSIAVFQNRSATPPSQETVTVPVLGFHSGGISGGDVLVEGYDAVNDEFLDGLRVGDWGLLGVERGNLHYLRWYRVVGVDDRDLATNTTNITLLGPDWHFGYIEDSEPTYFTWVRNVVAVYEKSMRIKTHGY